VIKSTDTVLLAKDKLTPWLWNSHRIMLLKYHKSRFKSAWTFFSCIYICTGCFLISKVLNKKFISLWKLTSSKERNCCQRRRKLFLPSCCSLEGWNERWEHEEIRRLSSSLTEKNPKVFEPLLFASNYMWRNTSRTARSRELVQKLWIYSVVHDEAGRDSKSIFSPNSDSSSTKGTFLVGTLSLCFRFLDFFLCFL